MGIQIINKIIDLPIAREMSKKSTIVLFFFWRYSKVLRFALVSIREYYYADGKGVLDHS